VRRGGFLRQLGEDALVEGWACVVSEEVSQSAEGEEDGKGREGKGREGEGRTADAIHEFTAA